MVKLLIFVGLVLVSLGLILHFAPGLLKWFGHLPGDLHWKSNDFQVFIPVTSMIIISVLLTLIIQLWR
ncbi:MULTISPECIES: DUF2905 domain-containing protein [unclassified Endozoicomonas]|nr:MULTISPECIES: DUF2905 domain-containing protein [unclassified Endozoicomonas]